MISDYIIVNEYSANSFMQAVNQKINQGYQPYGNPFVSFSQHGSPSNFMQCMTKEKGNKEDGRFSRFTAS